MTATPPIKITRDKRLMVASALSSGAAAEHLSSVVALAWRARERADNCAFVCLDGGGDPDRVRNALAGAFLASDSTHLLLVDGAIGFDPAAVLDLLDLMESDEAYSIMAAACPAAHINWSLVAAAHGAGVGADDPAELARLAGQFALELADGEAELTLGQPVELASVDGGFLLIRRNVIETLCERHSELAYTPVPRDCVPGAFREVLHALFQSTVDPSSGRLLPGSTVMLYRARAAGFRLWLAPWLRTTNTAPARFDGALADLAVLEPSQPE
jgi:hypothetical protein